MLMENSVGLRDQLSEQALVSTRGAWKPREVDAPHLPGVACT